MIASEQAALTLADLVRQVAPDDGPLAEIILERADRLLAAAGGRNCKRALTEAEIDLLRAGGEPEGAA